MLRLKRFGMFVRGLSKNVSNSYVHWFHEMQIRLCAVSRRDTIHKFYEFHLYRFSNVTKLADVNKG
jgi:hypothetical protein